MPNKLLLFLEQVIFPIIIERGMLILNKESFTVGKMQQDFQQFISSVAQSFSSVWVLIFSFWKLETAIKISQLIENFLKMQRCLQPMCKGIINRENSTDNTVFMPLSEVNIGEIMEGVQVMSCFFWFIYFLIFVLRIIPAN